MALMGLCCAGQRVLRWGGRLDCQAGGGGQQWGPGHVWESGDSLGCSKPKLQSGGLTGQR